MNQVDNAKVNSIEEFGFEKFGNLLRRVNSFGQLNVQVSDGASLFSYRCATGFSPMYWARTSPTDADKVKSEFDDRLTQQFQSSRISLDIMSYSSNDYCIAVCSSVCFDKDCNEIEPGGYVAFQRGSIVIDKPGVGEEDFTQKVRSAATIYQGPPRRTLHLSLIHI